MSETQEKHIVNADNAEKILGWFRDRGGIAVWQSENLANPGASWTTPLRAADGGDPASPSWQAPRISRIITDPAECVVVTSREVKRFRVGVQVGSQGFTLKVTDGGSRKIRAAVAKAGPEAWHEFDYSTQEAVIFVPDDTVSLIDLAGVLHAGKAVV